MADLPFCSYSDPVECPYEGPDDTTLPEGVNDPDYFDFDGELAKLQQRNSRAQENNTELDTHANPVIADSKPGEWEVTPHTSRSGSVEERAAEIGKVIDSMGGKPWVNPWTGSPFELDDDAPDIVTALSASISDDEDDVPPQESTSIVLTMPLPASKKKATALEQVGTTSEKLNPAKNSVTKPQKIHEQIAHQAVPRSIKQVPPQATSQALPQAIHQSSQVVHQSVPQTNLQAPQAIQQSPTQSMYPLLPQAAIQVLPQSIQYAPFQGVRQPLAQGVQQSPQVIHKLVPQNDVQAHSQVTQHAPFQGVCQSPPQAVQLSPTQGMHHVIPQAALQTQPQLIHHPVPINIPRGFPQGLMQANQQYMSPYASVTPQKLVHKPGPMRTSRPAKRQARGPYTNYSPPGTQLESARGQIAKLIADKKRMEEKLDNLNPTNPNTGKTYVETLQSKNAVLNFETSMLAQKNAIRKSQVRSSEEKYEELIEKYNALASLSRAFQNEVDLWQRRYYELSAALYQPMLQDTEMSSD
ncbi:hypothetical protein N7499_000257 [Penicillium canescens]|nr:hypothetical protein N7499_000257 [Penicillium canescens]